MSWLTVERVTCLFAPIPKASSVTAGGFVVCLISLFRLDHWHQICPHSASPRAYATGRGILGTAEKQQATQNIPSQKRSSSISTESVNSLFPPCNPRRVYITS